MDEGSEVNPNRPSGERVILTDNKDGDKMTRIMNRRLEFLLYEKSERHDLEINGSSSIFFKKDLGERLKGFGQVEEVFRNYSSLYTSLFSVTLNDEDKQVLVQISEDQNQNSYREVHISGVDQNGDPLPSMILTVGRRTYDRHSWFTLAAHGKGLFTINEMSVAHAFCAFFNGLDSYPECDTLILSGEYAFYIQAFDGRVKWIKLNSNVSFFHEGVPFEIARVAFVVVDSLTDESTSNWWRGLSSVDSFLLS